MTFPIAHTSKKSTMKRFSPHDSVTGFPICSASASRGTTSSGRRAPTRSTDVLFLVLRVCTQRPGCGIYHTDPALADVAHHQQDKVY